MKHLLTIILAIALTISIILYTWSRQDNKRARLLVGYFAENTRDLIDQRLQFLDARIKFVKSFSGKQKTSKSYVVMLHLETLKNIMDSARVRLRNIEYASDKSERTTAYEAYKRWILSKKTAFTKTSEEFKWVLNPVLGLDKDLLPESVITTEGLSAIQVSTIILEDALFYAVYRETESVLVDAACLPD